MKAVAALFLFALIMPVAFAQKGQPAFGKVDKADLLMTDCDFDKGADAVVLIDYGSTNYEGGSMEFSAFKTVCERRIRIKILKEKGLSQADVKIICYNHNNEEKIVKLKAVTYNLDEGGNIKTTEVKKNAIYSKNIDGYRAVTSIAFPEVRVGSIIEYLYLIERETIRPKDWYFQGSIPVKYSECQLIIPRILRFSVQPSVIDPIEERQEVINENIRVGNSFMDTKSIKANYIMRSLPGIKPEPFMGASNDYKQRLNFELTQIHYSDTRVEDISLNWSDVIADLLKRADFGLQLDSKISSAQLFIEEAKQITDVELRMKFVYNNLRRQMKWNEEENYVYTDNGIAKAWETKSGNVADINLLLIKILDDAGIKATPILFSTRDHGLVRPLNPFINQFNTVMAYIVIKDKIFVLDATNKYISYKITPEKIVNTSGLLLEGENGTWKEISSGKYKYRVVTAVQGAVDTTGILTGVCLVNCSDYARVKRCEEWEKDKAVFKNDHFVRPYPAFKIEDIALANQEADSLPLEQKLKFSTILNSAGNYLYFSVNLFSGLEENPFLAGTRVSDIDFGVKQDYVLFGNFTIPQGYIFEGVPESISITTPDNGIVFNRSVQVESNLLSVRITIEFKKTFYSAGSYNEFAAFYKKMFDKLNEQVVIKKRTTP